MSDVGIAFSDATIFPETAVYDTAHQRLLAGSVRHGAVFVIDGDGTARQLVDDARLCSVLGIAVDELRGRLLALNADLGVGERRCGEPRSVAGIGIYDLGTGAPIRYVDLAALVPRDAHLANAVAIDAHGNAYVSDSFAARIYRIEPSGVASVWLEDEAFGGAGIGLNGLVVHPSGYLLAVKKNDGALFRIPLGEPSAWRRVKVSTSMRGADGVLLTPDGRLVVVANEVSGLANNAAFEVSSVDDWKSASVGQARRLGAVYPTVPVRVGGRLFFLHSRLDDLLGMGRDGAAPSRRARLDYLGELDARQWGHVAADAEPEVFVLAELQLVPGEAPPSWDELGAPLVARPGLLNLTWLGENTSRVIAFAAFDDTRHAQAFANDFFPAYAEQVGVGQSTKLFDARLTRAASREMGSVHFGGVLAKVPRAFVYTEVQVGVPFARVPWRERNPLIRANPGFLAKTWLSGMNTHTVGGLYAFETVDDAKHFAVDFFPRGAARQKAAFSALVYEAAPGEASSRNLHSPFFREERVPPANHASGAP